MTSGDCKLEKWLKDIVDRDDLVCAMSACMKDIYNKVHIPSMENVLLCREHYESVVKKGYLAEVFRDGEESIFIED